MSEFASTALAIPPASTPDTVRNPAVQRCLEACQHRIRVERAKGGDAYTAKCRGSEAYRLAMPDLSGYQNIQDFIACVTHGLIIEAIHPLDSARLLYAAQVATCALRREPKSTKPTP